MGRHDSTPGPFDTQPELWTGPPHKPRALSATRLRALSCATKRGGDLYAGSTGSALLNARTQRWPEEQERRTGRRPPPFEVGWGDTRPSGHAAATRPSATGAASARCHRSVRNPSAGAVNADVRLLKEANEKLEAKLAAMEIENDRLSKALEIRHAEADAMRMETTMLREQLAAREAAESALKQMGIVGTLVGSCGGTSGMARTATAFIADPDGVERGSTPSGEIIQC